MKRRTLLASTGSAAAAVLAGCLGQLTGSGSEDGDGNGNGDENGGENDSENGTDSSDENGTENDSENGTENGDENGDESDSENGTDSQSDENGDEQPREGRHYEVSSTGTAKGSPLDHEVTVDQPRIDSPDRPLILSVSVTNTSDETIRYGEKREALAMHESDGEFTLHDPREQWQRDEETGLWFAPEPVAITMDYQVGGLRPGESDTAELELVHEGPSPPEQPPESFSFGVSYGTTTKRGLPESGSEFGWEFTLAVVE